VVTIWGVGAGDEVGTISGKGGDGDAVTVGRTLLGAALGSSVGERSPD
jgi:hypothetical protein